VADLASVVDITRIPVTATRSGQIFPAMGNFNIGVYNEDITNIVWVSRRPSFQAGVGNAAPIQPLTTGIFSAARPLYAISASGTIVVTITPEGESINPSPAQIAAQINAIGLATEATQLGQNNNIPNNIGSVGAPLRGGSTIIYNTSGNINAAATVDLGTLTTVRVSYEAFLSLVDNSAGTLNRTVKVNIIFKDSVSGQIVDQTNFNIFPGASGGSARQILITGPMSGNQIDVTLTNNDTAQVAYVFMLLDTGRVYNHDHRFIGLTNPLATGQTGASYDTPGSLIIDTAPSIVNGTTTTRQLGMYNGMVNIHMASPGSNAGVWTITSLDDQAGNDGVVFGRVLTPPPTHDMASFAMPRASCVLSIKNNGASTSAFPTTITTQDH
jgi:hypothetical protein